ncbi:MAG: Hsp70 family protein [Pseudomonadota bacterium]
MLPTVVAPDEIVLGIDFGTSYSRATAIIDGNVQMVLDAGDASIPSVVHFPRQQDPIVGKDALKYLSSQPSTTVTSVKRLLGRSKSDPEVRSVDASVSYQIKSGPGDQVILRLHDQDFAPAQITAAILTKLRRLAERRFGGTIRHVVLTAPAEASGEYLIALKRAASLAQLEVLQFIAESLAGVLAYGLHAKPADRRIAVCDFGGGTFDASFVEQRGKSFRNVGYAGDPFLGGDDFDSAMAEGVSGIVFGKKQVDLHRDAVVWRELLLRCESVKRQISNSNEARLHLREAYMSGGVYEVDLMVERSWIEPRWQPLIERAEAVIRDLTATTGWTLSDIDEVVLIGGTTLVPMVRQALGKLFDKPLRTSDFADVAVAVGAAIQAAAWAKRSKGTTTTETTLPMLEVPRKTKDSG